MVEIQPIGICILQGDLIQYANSQLASLLNTSQENLCGSNFSQWFPSEERARIKGAQLDTSLHTFKSQMLDTDGCLVDVSILFESNSAPPPATMCVRIQDISDQLLLGRLGKLRSILHVEHPEHQNIQKIWSEVLRNAFTLSGMDFGGVFVPDSHGTLHNIETLDPLQLLDSVFPLITAVESRSSLFSPGGDLYWDPEMIPEDLRAKGLQCVMSFPVGREIKRMALVVLGSTKFAVMPLFLRQRHQLLAKQIQAIFEHYSYQEIEWAGEGRYYQLLSAVTGYLYWLEYNALGQTTLTHNAGCETITGYIAEELNQVSDPWTLLLPEEDLELFLNTLLSATETRQPATFEHRINHKDGSLRWVTNTLVPRIDENRSIFGFDGLVTDITERREFLNRLQQSEEKFLQLANNIDEVFWIYDFQINAPIYISPAFNTFFGFSENQVVPVIDAINEILFEEERDEVIRALREPYSNIEYRIRRKDRTISWVRTRTFPIKDENGNLVRLAGVSADITRYKEAAEKERLQQMQLIQADKMASLGILVSGVAHEINNPNNLIMFSADTLNDVLLDLAPILKAHLQEHPDEVIGGLPLSVLIQQIPELFRSITSGSERIKKIVESLKNFTRLDPGELNQTLDLNSVVGDAVMIVENLIKKSTSRFSIELQETLPKVLGNAQQIEQVIINLLTNACQALGHSQQAITLKTLYDAESLSVNVIVRDEGKGIAPENLKRILDPFFTTKRDTGGTGIGLAVSYSIVEAHKGKLVFDSEVGKGTCVTLSLPVREGAQIV